MTDTETVRLIVQCFRAPESVLAYVEDPVGHEQHSAIDIHYGATRFRLRPALNLGEGMVAIGRWYEDQAAWLDEVTSLNIGPTARRRTATGAGRSEQGLS